MLDRLKQKIIYSNLRDNIIFIRYIIKKYLKNKYLWKYEFRKLESNDKILLFFPSMSIDKPSFLNIGVRSFIESAKINNIQCDLVLCNSGLEICHLGGSPFSASTKMPCKTCYKVNKSLFSDLKIIEFSDFKLNHLGNLSDLDFDELKNFEYKGYKLGELVTTSIVWIIRNAKINKEHRDYYLKFINSGINFINYLEDLDIEGYSSVLVFNGIIFPENILFEYCKKNNINVATFESGFNLNNFPAIEFNYEATSNHNFEFNNYKLDDKELDLLNHRINLNRSLNTVSKQIVIYGNVSWDTSQFSSHTLFDSMFDWLDFITPILKDFPDYKFIYKTHPGENRPIKKTWFGLNEWYELNNLNNYSNFKVIKSTENIDTYETIKQSCLSLVYNSTVGLESVMLGVKSLAAAKTHYTDKGFVSYFDNKNDYEKYLRTMLELGDFKVKEESINQAQSYYFQLFNNIAFDLSNLGLKISENEFTFNSNLDLSSYFYEQEMKNLPKNFKQRKPLSRIFNAG